MCCPHRPGCLFVCIQGSSCLIMLLEAYFVQNVGFCPFLANLAKSESGGAVDASTATSASAVGAECVLQPLETCFLAASWPFESNQYLCHFQICAIIQVICGASSVQLCTSASAVLLCCCLSLPCARLWVFSASLFTANSFLHELGPRIGPGICVAS